MKQILQIEADFDKPELLRNMVERIATRRPDIGFYQQPVPSSQVALETSTTEVYVCGSLSIKERGNSMQLHFDSNFMFTCIKSKHTLYEMTWSVSLS